MPEHAIATPQRDATAAGMAAFAAGGNALDAALAAAAVLCVTYPHNCALGGDLIALVREPDGTTTSVNASGAAAAAASADRLRAAGAVTMPVTGPDTVTVPGLVAGWETLHGLGAALPWPAALAAAIERAEEGFAVGRSLAEAATDQAAEIAEDPGLRALLQHDGRPVREGETVRQPALAATLRTLAADGPRAFYDGPLAGRLIAGLRAAGCLLSDEDLAGFAPELTAPLRHRCGDLDLLTSPPNSSGVLLLQSQAALAAAGAADPLGADAGLYAELLRLGAEQRDAMLADPRTAPLAREGRPGGAAADARGAGLAREGKPGDVPFDRDAWLGDARLAELVALARARAGGDIPEPSGEPTPRPSGDTVAVAAVDGEGRAVSLIQSVFHSLGALLLEPQTGVLMHNRGSFFSLAPGHPNELAPGRRPAHTLMPALVERGGALRYALGTMGGKAHAQVLGQVLLRLEAGADPQAAVDAARWVVGGVEVGERDDTIRVEDDVAPAARAAIERAGMQPVAIGLRSEWTGHAQAIAVAADGTLRAGSDPRADGAAAVGGG